MQLYIGTQTEDTLNYVLKQKSTFKHLTICDGATAIQDELYKADIIHNLHLFIKNQLNTLNELDSLPTKLLSKNPHIIIICDEIVDDTMSLEQITPVYKEKVKHICDELAKRSQKVVRIQSGIGTLLKHKPHTRLCCLIRHGKTLGNLSKRYIGTTNEKLCTEGIDELKSLQLKGLYPASHLIYVSPLTRCIETAHILYPNHPLLSCNELRECNFGEFENKNYEELQNHPYYQKWVDSNGCLPFPNGETPALFTKRCVKGFLACMNHIPHKFSFTYNSPSWITFIVHGGTIMSILSELSLPKGDYFSFQIDNGQGYLCEYDFDKQTLTVLDYLS